MTIWRTIPVKDQPHITLAQWQVFELPNGDRHFCGYHYLGREGRVSSRIEDFDPETMTGRTRSGRVYKLAGEPGLNHDALYVWGRWQEINGVTQYEAVDIV